MLPTAKLEALKTAALSSDWSTAGEAFIELGWTPTLQLIVRRWNRSRLPFGCVMVTPWLRWSIRSYRTGKRRLPVYRTTGGRHAATNS